MFSIIGWLIIGLVVGALARLIMPGRDKMGCLATMLLGLAGSVVGGVVGGFIWQVPEGRILRPGFILSVIGAVLVLALWRAIRRSD